MTTTDEATRYERGLARLAEVDGEAGERVVASLCYEPPADFPLTCSRVADAPLEVRDGSSGIPIAWLAELSCIRYKLWWRRGISSTLRPQVRALAKQSHPLALRSFSGRGHRVHAAATCWSWYIATHKEDEPL